MRFLARARISRNRQARVKSQSALAPSGPRATREGGRGCRLSGQARAHRLRTREEPVRASATVRDTSRVAGVDRGRPASDSAPASRGSSRHADRASVDVASGRRIDCRGAAPESASVGTTEPPLATARRLMRTTRDTERLGASRARRRQHFEAPALRREASVGAARGALPRSAAESMSAVRDLCLWRNEPERGQLDRQGMPSSGADRTTAPAFSAVVRRGVDCLAPVQKRPRTDRELLGSSVSALDNAVSDTRNRHEAHRHADASLLGR